MASMFAVEAAAGAAAAGADGRASRRLSNGCRGTGGGAIAKFCERPKGSDAERLKADTDGILSC